MDKNKRNSLRYKMYYTNKINTRLTTPSTAEQILNIRKQLEEVLASANNKRTKKSPRSARLSPIINNQCYSPSLSIRESKKELMKSNPFQNDCVLADAEILAYKKFITSLTRIIQDTNQHTPESFSVSTSLHVQNTSLGTPKRTVEKKDTFLTRQDCMRMPYTYDNQDMYVTQRAEKTTYCRPVIYRKEFLSKAIEKNAKLQQIVKKLVQAREKEKQSEAWKNYINRLKNKHGYYDFQTNQMPRLFEREDEKILDIIDNSYDVRHSWKRPILCEHMFNDLYEANTVRDESNIRRRNWYVPPASTYKYANNSFCCPMSSQGRLLMMKKERRGPGYSLHQSGRYFRGSSIVVEKQPPSRKKSSTLKPCKAVKSHNPTDKIWECQAIQATEICGSNNKNNKISGANISELKSNNYEKVSSIVEKLKHKMSMTRDDNKKSSLVKIEHKLDTLIQSFNAFLEEIKLKKVPTNIKSEAVSCSSMVNRNSMFKTKSDTFNVLTKNNMICEVGQQNPHSSFVIPPCPINQDTINEIINEEKDKSDKVKNDIDKILNNSCQCAVQITTDIPTKEHSTEVTNSFYKRQQEDTIVEKVEPAAAEDGEMEKKERSMTIAVNTDPMGILALFRVSAETVRQILSYVPNLDYVTYLARRQLSHSSAVARYVCNICSASFTSPSALSDHIRGHDIANSKNCCVCRHVLDRLSHRDGLFACAHCGQMFTRAYCRELHEQTCSKTGSQSPSFVMLT